MIFGTNYKKEFGEYIGKWVEFFGEKKSIAGKLTEISGKKFYFNPYIKSISSFEDGKIFLKRVFEGEKTVYRAKKEETINIEPSNKEYLVNLCRNLNSVEKKKGINSQNEIGYKKNY